MKQKKHQVINTVTIMLTNLFIVLAIACSHNKGIHFNTAEEAVSACEKELSEIRKIKNCDVKQLASIINEWNIVVDTAFTTILRDTSVVSDRKTIIDFFTINDSVRANIIRLTNSEERTLDDILILKILTSKDRERIQASAELKKVREFVSSLDQEQIYDNANTAKQKLNTLLSDTTKMMKEYQLREFLREEDKCFRTLLQDLTVLTLEEMQDISNKTTQRIGNLYQAAELHAEEDINTRVMAYLMTRLNRRIILNAQYCVKDINEKKNLDNKQRTAYRWMLLQPYLAIDSKAAAFLDDKQITTLHQLSKELTECLLYLDGIEMNKDEERQNLTKTLIKYFTNQYIKDII